MFRGFISGVIWGGVAVLIVVGGASLLAPLPATVAPQTSAVEATTGSAKEDSAAIETPSKADESLGEEVQGAVEAKASEDDDTPLADTDSAPKPAPAMTQQALTAPEAGSNESENTDTPKAENPVIPAPQGRAPEVPEAEISVQADSAKAEESITTNPDQPAMPDVPEVGDVFETPAPAPEVDMTPETEAGEAQGQAPATMMKPVATLEESFPQHKSSRLPTVGEDTEVAVAPKPFEVNAEAFAGREGKPLMSVVLIDDGRAPVDKTMFAGVPFPLSIAINTLSKDATAREATYREMGIETLAMIDIPAMAAPADVEVAMGAHLKAMPGAVAVLEGTGDGLQGARALSDQVTKVVLASGHGMVLFPNGLDTVRKLASREGIPAATVFRDFDGNGQSAAVIQRFLDQAAFKADREGGVIMVGRVREETLSALMVWRLQDRASTVSLAPVSAVLRAKSAQ